MCEKGDLLVLKFVFDLLLGLALQVEQGGKPRKNRVEFASSVKQFGKQPDYRSVNESHYECAPTDAAYFAEKRERHNHACGKAGKVYDGFQKG